MRYEDAWDEDDEWRPTKIARTPHVVTYGYVEDSRQKHWHTTNSVRHTDLVISEEPRCAHCHQNVPVMYMEHQPRDL